MPRPSWATPKQYEWLQAQGELFKAHQIDVKAAKAGKKTAPRFWPTFFEAWEIQWPAPGLDDLVNAQVDSEQTVDKNEDANEGSTATPVPEPVDEKKKRGPLTVRGVSVCYVPFRSTFAHVTKASKGLDL